MDNTLVLMEGIEKHFPGVHALSQARFDLHPGEVHALVGENGAGKSTLMKILSGIYSKDGGRVVVRGQEVDIPHPRAAQHLGISMIHQELNLMNHLTVAQNIFIGREPRQAIPFMLDEKKINQDAIKYLDMLQTALDKGPDALVFAALDSKAAIPLLERAQEEGIPVIAFDSGVDSDIPLATAATDNVAAAAYAADKMAELIGGEGQVAVIAHDQTSRTGIDRVDGFTTRM
jgi:ABC-type sugar transport system ATPase subunit